MALLGVGDTGSYILYTLAAMGTGFVRAVDFDEVQLSNLSRQILYTHADVGKLKIDCAREFTSSILIWMTNTLTRKLKQSRI